MSNVFEICKTMDTTGIIFGTHNGDVVSLSSDKLNQYGNIIAIGGAGTGKTFNVNLNYIFQLIKRGESAVINDPFGEIYMRTVAKFESEGYRVRVFNPANPKHSDGFNALSTGNYGYMYGTMFLCQEIMNGADRSELYREDSEWLTQLGSDVKGLLDAVLQYVGKREVGLYDKKKSLAAVYDLLNDDTDLLQSAYLSVKGTHHPSCGKLGSFCQKSKKRKKDAIDKVKEMLEPFVMGSARELTTTNDLDFSLCGKEKCAYFIISDNSYLSNFLWKIAIHRIMATENARKNISVSVPINFVVDNCEELPLSLQGLFPVNKCGVRPHLRTLICQQGFEDVLYPLSSFDVCLLLGSGGNNDEQTLQLFLTLCQSDTVSESEQAKISPTDLRKMKKTEVAAFVPSENTALMLNKIDYAEYHKLKRSFVKNYVPVRLRPVRFYSTDAHGIHTESV